MKTLNTIVLILISLQLLQAQELAPRIDDYVSSYVNTGDFRGCIRIAEKGEVIYEHCFGLASETYNIANTGNTKFKIGSISKQFTAAAILLLEEEDLLKTTDTISRFFQNSVLAKTITIQQLLTHTSGVTDVFNLPGFSTFSCTNINSSELAGLLLETAPDFEPGTEYRYSNGGYALLAEIIEQVSGQTYRDYLHENIFTPLEMTASGHHNIQKITPDLAAGYDPLGYHDVQPTAYLDPELLKGSGSLYSTLNDMDIWINSIKHRSLLSEASYDKLLYDHGHNYGLGISVYKVFEQEVFGHDGRINGFIADYLHFRAADISVIILGNIQTGIADFFRRDLAAIVFDKPVKYTAKSILPGDETALNRQKFTGTYSFGPGFKVHVEEIDGRLQARANEGGYSELILLDNQSFFSRLLYAFITFASNDDGVITSMIWTNNDGNSFTGSKE